MDYSPYWVFVIGHFAPVQGDKEDGDMERIIFSNKTITSAAELNSLV